MAALARARKRRSLLVALLVIGIFFSPLYSLITLDPPVQRSFMNIIADTRVVSQDQPPFEAPPPTAATIRNGSVTAAVSGYDVRFDWRLFSPVLDGFQPCDFWLSFDLTWNQSDALSWLELHSLDRTNRNENSRLYIGAGAVEDTLYEGEEFIQYTFFQNATYLFLNDSVTNDLHYPEAESELEIVTGIMTVTGISLPLFNITVQTETLLPEIELLYPPVEVDGYQRTMTLNNHTRTLTVNVSDPSGIAHVSLLGAYIDDRTGWIEHLTFAETGQISSGVPIDLQLSVDSVLLYADITDQDPAELDSISISASVQAEDLTGLGNSSSVTIEFTLLRDQSTSTSTTMTGTSTTNGTGTHSELDDYYVALLSTAAAAVVVVLTVLLNERRRN